MCTIWEYRKPALFNLYFDKEIEQLILELKPHQTSFKKLKDFFPQIDSVLQIVMYVNETTPSLHFSTAVMRFLIDLDTLQWIVIFTISKLDYSTIVFAF